jgi:hypothetical protein
VRSDGLHFEQSVYYHVYALDFFLHAMLLARRNDVPVPTTFEATVRRMVEALVSLSPGGLAPRMGDDDGGRLFDAARNRPQHMLDPVATAAAVFERPEWRAVAGPPIEETLWLLGPDRLDRRERAPIASMAAPTTQSLALPQSGQYVFGDRNGSGWRMVVDAGPQGTGRCGHGHADALFAQLASRHCDWLIDVGTATYMRPHERDRFRGTAAHNTLTAGGADQAVPTEPFAWRDIPGVEIERWEQKAAFDYLRAAHDGYERPPAPLTHRRTVLATDAFWLVRDQAIGDGTTELVVAWHMAPWLSVPHAAQRRLRAACGDESLTLAFAGPEEWTVALEDGEWSPAYGAVEPIHVVRLRCDARLPTEVASLILPHDWAGSFAYRRLENAVVYDISDERRSFRVVFGQGPWQVGGYAGNHELALLHGASPAELTLAGAISAAV